MKNRNITSLAHRFRIIIDWSFFLVITILAIAYISPHGPDISAADEKQDYLAEESAIPLYPGTLDDLLDGPINRSELVKALVLANGLQPDAEIYRDCFDDISTETYAPYICFAKARGWIHGYPDNTFRPTDKLNNAESIKVIMRAQAFAISFSESSYENYFTDVPEDAWFAPYVWAAKERNIIPTQTRNFNPASASTKQLIEEYLFRIQVITEKNLSSYTEEEGQEVLAE